MKQHETAHRKIPVAWIAALLLAGMAAALLWTQIGQTTQATRAFHLGIAFDGEYRIGDGTWQPVTAGEHIPATRGDVTLRGSFHYIDPYTGERFAPAATGICIALYFNHISCTIEEAEAEPYVCDAENPLIGISACGKIWSTYALQGEGDKPLTILLHNPHRFGNENAVDDFLNSLSAYGGSTFERQQVDAEKYERTLGLALVLFAFTAFGIGLFSFLLHIAQTKLFWQTGCLLLFAGGYTLFRGANVSFWNWSIVCNTTILGLCAMLYMVSLSWIMTSMLGEKTKKIGNWALTFSNAVCVLLLLLSILGKLSYYDTYLPWAVAQSGVCLVMIGCLLYEVRNGDRQRRLMCSCGIFPLLAFLLDCVATKFGWWQGGTASGFVFVFFFVCMLILVLRPVPRYLLAAANAEKMEAELQKSRAAIMISQIRPHFIYNTLGTIEALCETQPKAAASLVHNFARYLRGNFSELDNPSPIRMSQEMEHVRCYVSIELVRFPDITVNFDIQSEDFLLPALSVQPLVENAIKHGLMQLAEGGTVTVSAYETDIHYCICVQDNGGGFDTSHLWEDREHIGLRNIRERIEVICAGTLTVESTPGVGTNVLISIPKEEKNDCHRSR